MTWAVNRFAELEERQQPQLPRSSEELEDLQKLLHFPEEVALRLAETEYQLFYLVPPGDYLRHVEEELAAAAQKRQQECTQRGPNLPGLTLSSAGSPLINSATQTDDDKVTMQILISRYSEVS